MARSSSGPVSMPRSPIRRRLPTSSSAPSTRASRPRPGRAVKDSRGGSERPRARAASTTARPSGCSLPVWAAAARASRRLSSPANAIASRSSGRPIVSVPVLSKTTRSTSRARSSDSASCTRMPARAAAPIPTVRAVGVASPSAQGQAITSTETACRIATLAGAPAISQPARLAAETTSTKGTKTAATRSTRRSTGALLPCAPSTSATICASSESEPTRVASTCSRPEPLIEPPMTSPATPRATGMLSPVSRDSSSWLSPRTMRPSTGTRSPGRTTTTSPQPTASAGTSISTPSRSTRARSGRSFIKARTAPVVPRRALASSSLPSSTSVITAAEASK